MKRIIQLTCYVIVCYMYRCMEAFLRPFDKLRVPSTGSGQERLPLHLIHRKAQRSV